MDLGTMSRGSPSHSRCALSENIHFFGSSGDFVTSALVSGLQYLVLPNLVPDFLRKHI